MSRLLAAVAAVAVVVSSFAVNTNIALGHERRAVGPYTFVVGWMNEPAYVNAANGLSLEVTETSGDKPVDGLATTLHAEVIVGGGAKKLVLTLLTDDEFRAKAIRASMARFPLTADEETISWYIIAVGVALRLSATGPRVHLAPAKLISDGHPLANSRRRVRH